MAEANDPVEAAYKAWRTSLSKMGTPNKRGSVAFRDFRAGYEAALREAAKVCRGRADDWNEQNVGAASRSAKNRTYQRGTEARECAAAIESLAASKRAGMGGG